jgi:hypothetical protein
MQVSPYTKEAGLGEMVYWNEIPKDNIILTSPQKVFDRAIMF